MVYNPPGSSVHGDSPGKNTGVGCHALLQGFFLTQGSNPGLPHCSWILYHVSHQRSPRILVWIAIPFTGDLLDPGIEPGSPALQANSLPAKLPGKPFSDYALLPKKKERKKGKQGLKGRHTLFQDVIMSSKPRRHKYAPGMSSVGHWHTQQAGTS